MLRSVPPTTAGLTERFTRGVMGELKTWQIADHAPLTFEHDLRGKERYQTAYYKRQNAATRCLTCYKNSMLLI